MLTLTRRAAFGLLATPAFAQSFPSRPVRLVVGFPPGGATDGSARVIAEYLGQRYGTAMVVENRPGASGAIAGEFVARSAPDGHTWLIAANFALANGHLLNPRMSYHPLRDLAPASMVFTTDHVITVNDAMQARSIAEFVAEAKARNLVVRYGTSGMGSTSHMLGEMLKQQTGVELVHVPYRGQAGAVTDQLAGTIEMVIDQIPTSIAHIRAGRVKALATTGGTRHPSLPDVQTASETLPGFEARSWNGIAVAAGTPPALVARISADIREALAAPASQARLAPLGADYAGSTPEEMAAVIGAEEARWAPVIRAAGISIT
jgi:tripartite-type tricarboxylate transporter receptor subunit TctC